MLLSIEHLKALTQMVQTELDRKHAAHLNLLRRYLFSSNVSFLQEVSDGKILKDVATLITFFELPINVMNCVELNGAGGKPNLFRLFVELKKHNLDLTSIKCISDIIAWSMSDTTSLVDVDRNTLPFWEIVNVYYLLLRSEKPPNKWIMIIFPNYVLCVLIFS